ncbi:excinuclease ABC subunit UvrC, partial [Cellulomonas aerilata]|uniref:excinuclease ABC subunit UvrC n=1 Tax=Cellulomonas aerilata TaxID=515326 RepID=UPI0031DCFCDF
MAGDTAKFTRRLTERMRDDIGALERATEKNAVVLQDGTDADIFALVGDELEAAVQVFHVRDGRIRGQRGWIVEKVEDVSDGELVEHLLQQVYGAEEAALAGHGSRSRGEPATGAAAGVVPREVLVPVMPPDAAEVSAWLSGMRGSRVDVRVPQRGDKRELAETVRRNAEHALALHRTKRAGDLTTRSQALREIQEALDLPTAPLRIECYDISTTQGTHQMASMVVFEDGLARKSEYRTFAIRGPEGDGARDDTAAMHEVITRRFRRYVADRVRTGDLEMGAGDDDDQAFDTGARAAPRSGEVEAEVEAEDAGRRRFAYPPNLVVVDGGPPQVAAAARALAELGVDDVALCGLAKRLEEVWLPGEDYPVILQRSSEGLYLLQRVRDEAHRFAITAHRRRRSKGMTVSALDDVPGLGPARSRTLLKHFGSLKRLRAASVEEIASVPGMGQRTAAAVVAALATADPVAPRAGDVDAGPAGAGGAPADRPDDPAVERRGAPDGAVMEEPPGIVGADPGATDLPADGSALPEPRQAAAGVPGMLSA